MFGNSQCELLILEAFFKLTVHIPDLQNKHAYVNFVPYEIFMKLILIVLVLFTSVLTYANTQLFSCI